MKNSSGSQFYIVENPDACKHLDGEYTIFGETIDGFDVIDRIAAVQTDERYCPIEDIRIINILPVLPEPAAMADSTAIGTAAENTVKTE